jgi:hypothetical protein
LVEAIAATVAEMITLGIGDIAAVEELSFALIDALLFDRVLTIESGTTPTFFAIIVHRLRLKNQMLESNAKRIVAFVTAVIRLAVSVGLRRRTAEENQCENRAVVTNSTIASEK